MRGKLEVLGRLLLAVFVGILTISAPAQAQTQTRQRSGEEVVKAQCAKCHQSGLHGAPRIDDRAAWAPRLKNGVDATVRSAMKGHGAMPARGGLADLSDVELRAAILYMFYPGAAALRNAPAAAPAAPDPHHKTVGGMEVYLGIVPAEVAKVKAAKPSGRDYYFVNITLRDSASGSAIKDAQVEVRAANPVSGGDTLKLEPASANAVPSFGNFFRMRGREPYTLTVKIQRPGSAAAEARFEFKP